MIWCCIILRKYIFQVTFFFVKVYQAVYNIKPYYKQYTKLLCKCIDMIKELYMYL